MKTVLTLEAFREEAARRGATEVIESTEDPGVYLALDPKSPGWYDPNTGLGTLGFWAPLWTVADLEGDNVGDDLELLGISGPIERDAFVGIFYDKDEEWEWFFAT